MEKGLEMATTNKGRASPVGSPNQVDLEFVSESRAVCAKTDALVAYGLGFGCSADAQKAKKINFSMSLLLCPNLSGVIMNRRSKLTSIICVNAKLPSFGPLSRVLFLGPLGSSGVEVIPNLSFSSHCSR